jgi:hypothetical protein
MVNRKVTSFTWRFLLGVLPGMLIVGPSVAAGPPCRPCAGIRVDDPAILLEELRGPSRGSKVRLASTLRGRSDSTAALR